MFFPLLFPPEDGYVRMFLRGRPVTIHIPDQQRESYSLDQKVVLPDHKLKLQWVYPSGWGRETMGGKTWDKDTAYLTNCSS